MNEVDFTSLPRIDMDSIATFIAQVPYLTSLQRDFYIAYLSARKTKLFG